MQGREKVLVKRSLAEGQPSEVRVKKNTTIHTQQQSGPLSTHQSSSAAEGPWQLSEIFLMKSRQKSRASAADSGSILCDWGKNFSVVQMSNH